MVQTGSFLTVDLATPWFAALKREDWSKVYPDADAENMAAVCGAHPYGDRRVELVLQGCGLDRVSLAAELDGCLLTQAELERGPEQWAELEDPFRMITNQTKLLHSQGPVNPAGDSMVEDEAVTTTTSDSMLEDEAVTMSLNEIEHMVNSMQQLGPNSLFLVAVEAALFSWDPLIFVLNEGTRDDPMDVAEWMVGVVAELFNKGKKVECDEVEDYLCDIIEAEFNMHFEEVSPETVHVSRQICQFYADCATGGNDPMFAFIYKVGKARNRFDDHFPAPLLARSMATEKPEPEPEPEEAEEEEVDPDGWETVKPKKKGDRK